MYAWEAIQHSIDYIEEHLDEKMQIEELAKVASLSQFYYQRLFHRLIHKTPMEYIRLRRLATAALYMRENHKKIIEIALDFGFENHETFTRAFKETYGMTPEQYRKDPIIMNHFNKNDLSLNYVMMEENIPLISDDMVLEVFYKDMAQERYFIGLETELAISELMGEDTGPATGPRMWDELHQRKQEIPNLLVDGNEIGSLSIGDAKEGYCKYLAAAEVTSLDNIPEGFQAFTIYKGTYLICGFEAEDEATLYGNAVFKADQFMNSWKAYHKVSLTNFGVEMYYRDSQVPYLEHWGQVNQGL